MVAPIVITKYSVSVTDENGCISNDEVTVNVTDVRCGTNNDKVLLCHLSNTGKWEKICVDSSSVKTHLDKGDYLGPCVNNSRNSSDPIKSNVLKNTNLPEFVLYPNPAQGIFKVVHNLGDDTPSLFEISDLRGKKMLTISASQLQNNSMLNLTLLPQGVYIYRVREGEKIISIGRLAVVY